MRKNTCVYMYLLCTYVLNLSPLAHILVFPFDAETILAMKSRKLKKIQQTLPNYTANRADDILCLGF